MVNTPNDFLIKHKDKLIQMVQDYLDSCVSFFELQEYIWYILDDWEVLPDEVKDQSYIKGEAAFWAIVGDIMGTPSDEMHLLGLQKELPVLLECLRFMKKLPRGCDSKRPS